MADGAWRSEDLDADAAAWAMSAEGLAWLADLLGDEVGSGRGAGSDDDLAVATRLRAAGLDPARAAAVQGIAAASGRARGAGQPSHTWWTPSAAEQASHPAVAAWRAARFAGAPVTDLTAGCGGDALALVDRAAELIAVERSAVRVPILRANLADRAAVVRGDATAPCLRPAAWWAWADPGRRVAGRRVRGLADTVPPVPGLATTGWTGLGVAVSPAVDLGDPARPPDAELEFVQVDRQLVEATLWLGATRDTGPGEPHAASATLLPEGVHVRGTPAPPGGSVEEVTVGAWLAEPAPALVRARLVDDVAAELGLARLARRRALFVGSQPLDSPWFRCERVEAVVPARPARVRDALQGLDELPLELLVHGMSVDVRAWWRGLGSPPRGPQGRAVHLVRLDDTSLAVLTRRGSA